MRSFLFAALAALCTIFALCWAGVLSCKRVPYFSRDAEFDSDTEELFAALGDESAPYTELDLETGPTNDAELQAKRLAGLVT